MHHLQWTPPGIQPQGEGAEPEEQDEGGEEFWRVKPLLVYQRLGGFFLKREAANQYQPRGSLFPFFQEVFGRSPSYFDTLSDMKGHQAGLELGHLLLQDP